MSDARDELERLFREDGARLWRALFAYCRDREIAEDARAEAFAQALSAADGLRSPPAWVWKVAFRIAAGELKERARSSPRLGEPVYDLPDPIDHVVAALGRLSPNQRLAVILHDYADRPVDEIAETMRVTKTTVHVHLSQGRKRLKTYLEDADG